MCAFYKRLFFVLTFIFSSKNFIFSQIIALWEFDNSITATTTPTNGTVSDATWSAGTVSYTAGNSSVTTDKSISTSSFNSLTLNTAKYLQFTIAPNSNFAMSLRKISFYEQRSGTGPTTWVLRSSLDNFTSNLNSSTTTSTAFSSTPQSVDFGIDFQYITQNVSFRIYAYGASGGTGTWRIDDLSIEGAFLDITNPILVSSESSFSFTNILQGSPSVPKSFLAAGFGLTDNLTISAPNGYEVSLSESANYATSLVLVQTSGRVTAQRIYVRLSGQSVGTFNSNLTLTSPNIATQNIALTGAVVNTPTRSVITSVRSRSNGTSVVTNGRVTVSNAFGGNQIFIQDATGGISVYSNTVNIADYYALQIGDSVEVYGTKTTVSGLEQINMLTFSKINTPPSVPSAVVITQANLAANEGRLVTIQDVEYPGSGGNYSANNNYAFGYLPVRIISTEIPASNNIVGTPIQAARGNVTGIAGVFGSSVQLYPRSTADFEITGVGASDATFQNENTLDLVTWNLEWFGHPTNGPTNDTLQATNVKTVITTINADIYEFEEVSDSLAFTNMIASIGGYSCKCSHEYSFSNTSSADIYGQRLCFVYKTALFSNVNTMPLLVNFKNDTTLLPDYPNTRTRFWASGRLPFLLTATVSINNTTRNMGFVGIHARANTSANAAQDVYDMRKYDVEKLKTYLDATYPNTPMIISGDFNDDLDFTVSNVSTSVSTYTAYINDPSRYTLFTLPLSKAGASSASSDMIDHIIGTNEMGNALQKVRVGTPQTYITSYSSRTSDHYPVMAQFDLTPIAILPVNLLSFKAILLEKNNAKIYWATASEQNTDYFVVEKSDNGQDFEPINTVKALGNSNNTQNYDVLDNDILGKSIIYYRLKIIDNDGTYKYSKIITLKMPTKPFVLDISPNPVDNILTINNNETIKSLCIYNIQGVLMYKGNDKNIVTSAFPAGIYIVEAADTEGGVFRTRFVKQ